jgi:hypothetical protein
VEEEDSDNERTRANAKVGKQGLNEYEKALWQWVNVDDLDGFLQEVSLVPGWCKLTKGLYFLQREGVLLYFPGQAAQPIVRV